MKNKTSIPLFTNPYLEKLSHVHPLTPLLFWTPVILWLLWRSFFLKQIPLDLALPLFISGVLLWTLVEYLLHRFFFHFEGKGKISKRIIYIFHGIHHEDPDDGTRLVMPIIPGALYAYFFFSSFRLILGQDYAETLLAFFLIGYLFYDYIHYSIHHFVPKTKIGRSLRRSHLIHHTRGDIRYGVSSPLWDILLGTLGKK